MAFFNFDRYGSRGQPAQPSGMDRHNQAVKKISDYAAANTLARQKQQAEEKHLANTNWARGAGQGALLGGSVLGAPGAIGGAVLGAIPGFVGGWNEAKGPWYNKLGQALSNPFESGAAMDNTFSGLAPAAAMLAMNRSMKSGDAPGTRNGVGQMSGNAGSYGNYWGQGGGGVPSDYYQDEDWSFSDWLSGLTEPEYGTQEWADYWNSKEHEQFKL